MENMIFDAENVKNMESTVKHKNKAKTNKIKLCMHPKSGSNTFAVFIS